MAKLFVEAIVAPEFTADALTTLSTKKNLRVLRLRPAAPKRMLKQISGGFLLQDEDHATATAADLTCPTQRKPTPDETAALLFAWKVCKHVKSNAIVYARLQSGPNGGFGPDGRHRGRADEPRGRSALRRDEGRAAAGPARSRRPTPSSPSRTAWRAVANAGATAVIQPGGSVRDEEVIAAADRLGIAMVFTGVRHFGTDNSLVEVQIRIQNLYITV